MRRMLVRDVQIVDVVRERVFPGWLLVEDGLVATVGEGADPLSGDAAPWGDAATTEVVDGQGLYAVPGLIDAHTHIESSFVTPRRFAEAVVPSGTTAIVADPHEIANVLGEDGVRYMLAASRDLPLRVFFSVPSCVPATAAELETSGAEWGPAEIRRVFALDERCIALGEMMDYRAVVEGEARAAAILAEAREHGWLVEGHCPSLVGDERAAYFAAGIQTDHTLMNPEKIRDELRLGVWVELQEKSIVPENIAVLTSGVPMDKVLFVTDDFPPSEFAGGHLVSNLRKAINLGLTPLEALASATIRPARLMDLKGLGALELGYHADFFLTSDLATLPIQRVFVGGVEVSRTTGATTEAMVNSAPVGCLAAPRLSAEDFAFPGLAGPKRCRIIRTNGENTLTNLETRVIEFDAGCPVLSADDVAMVAVCERHHNTGRRALGFLAGFGRINGAVASTVAHDSHNLVVIGSDRGDMAAAANHLIASGGGLAAVQGGELKAFVSLPVAGLLSDAPVDVISRDVRRFEAVLREIGVTHRRGLMFLTMVTLSTSPHVKISDRGLVDVDARRLIPVVEEETASV